MNPTPFFYSLNETIDAVLQDVIFCCDQWHLRFFKRISILKPTSTSNDVKQREYASKGVALWRRPAVWGMELLYSEGPTNPGVAGRCVAPVIISPAGYQFDLGDERIEREACCDEARSKGIPRAPAEDRPTTGGPVPREGLAHGGRCGHPRRDRRRRGSCRASPKRRPSVRHVIRTFTSARSAATAPRAIQRPAGWGRHSTILERVSH